MDFRALLPTIPAATPPATAPTFSEQVRRFEDALCGLELSAASLRASRPQASTR